MTIDDCDWGDFDVEAAALFYTILEFATSVKPAFMRSLLRQGWDRVTYLDPDIQVFADFTRLLDEHAGSLADPALLHRHPSRRSAAIDHYVLMAGFFNLGFCSARPSAMSFLDWWSAQLQFECLNNHLAGHFTDQKVVDMAQLMAKVQVLTEPGLNVAYWNLHERRVVEQGEGWAVQAKDRTEPLYFFHFSGFQLGGGASLSLHSSRAVLGEAVPRRFVTQYEDQRCAIEDESPYPFTLGGARLAEPIPVPWNHCIREDAEVHVRAGVTLRQVREQIYAPSHDDADSVCRACGDSHDHFGARVSRFLEGWSCHPSLVGVPNGVSAFFRRLRVKLKRLFDRAEFAVVIRKIVPNGGIFGIQFARLLQLLQLPVVVAHVMKKTRKRHARVSVGGIPLDQILVTQAHRFESLANPAVQFRVGRGRVSGFEFVVFLDPPVDFGLRGIILIHQFLQLLFRGIIGGGGIRGIRRGVLDEVGDSRGRFDGQDSAK